MKRVHGLAQRAHLGIGRLQFARGNTFGLISTSRSRPGSSAANCAPSKSRTSAACDAPQITSSAGCAPERSSETPCTSAPAFTSASMAGCMPATTAGSATGKPRSGDQAIRRPAHSAVEPIEIIDAAPGNGEGITRVRPRQHVQQQGAVSDIARQAAIDRERAHRAPENSAPRRSSASIRTRR